MRRHLLTKERQGNKIRNYFRGDEATRLLCVGTSADEQEEFQDDEEFSDQNGAFLKLLHKNVRNERNDRKRG